MARPAPCNKGFTLVELMIAVLIIMVSMLALLTAITSSIRTNMNNEIRNAAVRVTNQTAEALLSLPLEDAELATGATHTRVAGDPTQAQKGIPDTTLRMRDFTATYVITWTIAAPTTDLKQINISVSYVLNNTTYTNSAVTYKYRAI